MAFSMSLGSWAIATVSDVSGFMMVGPSLGPVPGCVIRTAVREAPGANRVPPRLRARSALGPPGLGDVDPAQGQEPLIAGFELLVVMQDQLDQLIAAEQA